MARLTKLEKKALVDIINERIAGGHEELRDSFGITDKEAEAMMKRLESALIKLC